MQPVQARDHKAQRIQHFTSKMERFERKSRTFALYGYCVLGPAFVSAIVVADWSTGWLALVLFAITPSTYFALHHFARWRGVYPPPDGRSMAHVVRSLAVMALVFAAAVLGYRHWGANAGAIGSVAYYGVTWLAARRLATHTHVVRERRGLPGPGLE